jgi:K+-transporting ATPase B subunit
LFDPVLVRPAIAAAFKKLSPQVQWRNPVMFVVYIGSILTTILWVQAWGGKGEASQGFILAIAVWLWFTVLFANFAEALAEGRSKAQAASLRGLKQHTHAKKLQEPRHDAQWLPARSDELRKGDVVLVNAGDVIPLDGEVIEGVASVDESAITGESAPVIRESGGDFSAVTGGTKVLSDWLVVRVSVNPGEAFLDRMIAMVEGAKRQKTPNEIALTILLVALTLIFLLATATLLPYSLFGVRTAQAGQPVTLTALVALLVCLIPTTIGGLLSAIGVAGMSRMMQRQRDRHLGPRGRGGGRRGRAAARQDRHHHAGQPPGLGLHSGARRDGAPAGRCRAARLAGRRDPRGPQHRRAGQAAPRPARPRDERARSQLRAVHGADAHERRRSRPRRSGAPDPQGCRRVGAQAH